VAGALTGLAHARERERERERERKREREHCQLLVSKQLCREELSRAARLTPPRWRRSARWIAARRLSSSWSRCVCVCVCVCVCDCVWHALDCCGAGADAQMRLGLARKDYIRTQIISKKISTRFFEDPTTDVRSACL
jgi:hypothetical protein